MKLFGTPRRRQLVVMLVGGTLLVVAFTIISYPQFYGLTVGNAIWSALFVALLAIVSNSLGARWIQAARSVASSSEGLADKRIRFVGRTSRILAVVLGLAAAVATPLYLPEAKSMNWLVAAATGGLVGGLVGWGIGHLAASDIWTSLMPKSKK